MAKKAKTKRNFTIQPGDRFGRLVVVAYAGKRRSKSGKSESNYWDCVCDCGGEKTTRTRSLRAGYTQSCGCLQKERAGPPVKHGMGGTPEYRAWQHMKNRCLNPNAQEWPHYGARGIRVHAAWQESFELFFEHVGEKPEPKEAYSLDRIDNDGHYEPGNVRWATSQEQNENRRPHFQRRMQQEHPGIGKLWYWRGQWRTHEPGGILDDPTLPRKAPKEVQAEKLRRRHGLARCSASTGIGQCHNIVSEEGERCYMHKEEDE